RRLQQRVMEEILPPATPAAFYTIVFEARVTEPHRDFVIARNVGETALAVNYVAEHVSRSVVDGRRCDTDVDVVDVVLPDADVTAAALSFNSIVVDISDDILINVAVGARRAIGPEVVAAADSILEPLVICARAVNLVITNYVLRSGF